MRRFPFIFAALLAAWSVEASAQSRPLPVAAGQAISLPMDGAVRDVVIGDPDIADVSVVSDRALVVLGKRPGVTSLLVFGPGGRPLTDRQVVVSEGGAVTVYRGASASSYACGRQCTRLSPPAAGSPP
ncbi:pilus assembly protein N-terminal domain-containing protein [Caulobacter sp. CCH9-E1]|jgi:Flp pilus assembly secretin CpaC|uniref:pilus assembly protein N-terminal domain-containing protein n=1 Tax=Caulobacter sp. CCH9-E1 TaxID=1768768 RepID=UPI00082EA516